MVRTLRILALLLTLALAMLPVRPASSADAKPDAGAAYNQEVEAWRKTRVEGLKREDGWFTLVGLFWLDEGENRFGSASSNKVILPEGKAPAVAGRLVRKGDAVRARIEPGAKVTHGGKPVTELDLQHDLAGEPTILQLGSVSFFVVKRGDRIGVRVKDTEAKALKAFHGLDNYAIDPSWRVTARFEPYQPPRQVPIPNVLGTIDDTPSPGAVVFERGGQSWRLEALEGSPDGGLFLIFADQTNGKETYGAGRFLSTEPPKDGKVVVDFNKAYNPPCAFSAYATCPLPPRENRLALRIEAGEKKYGDH